MYNSYQSTQWLSSPATMELGVYVQTKDVVDVVTELLLYKRLDELHPASRDLLPTVGAGDRKHHQLQVEQAAKRLVLSGCTDIRRLWVDCLRSVLYVYLSAWGHVHMRNLVLLVREHVHLHVKTNKEVMLCRLQKGFQEPDVSVEKIRGVTSKCNAVFWLVWKAECWHFRHTFQQRTQWLQ